MPPARSLCQVCFGYSGLFWWFHANFKFVCSIYGKHTIGILITIALTVDCFCPEMYLLKISECYFFLM